MIKRGPIILTTGLIITGISLLIIMSITSSIPTGPGTPSIPLMFGDIFDQISNEIRIDAGDTIQTSYVTHSSDVLLLWGVQIMDYQPSDKVSITISNIFGDDYGTFTQSDFIMFEVLEIEQSDTLKFDIQNLGDQTMYITVMFAEDSEDSAFFDAESPLTTILLPIAYAGIALVVGVIVSMIGAIITLIDWKNKRNVSEVY